MGKKNNAYRAFTSKTARKRQLGKTGHERLNKIESDIKETRLGVAASTGFIRRRIGTICEHDSEPSICIKSGEFLDCLRNLLLVASQEGLCCTEL
jgi:hypothetical protein